MHALMSEPGVFMFITLVFSIFKVILNLNSLFGAGILTHWRVLWVSCEFPCKGWFRVQVFGRNCAPIRQTESSGLFKIYVS